MKITVLSVDHSWSKDTGFMDIGQGIGESNLSEPFVFNNLGYIVCLILKEIQYLIRISINALIQLLVN